jgi:flagellum-specific peptidoglycan hydrolase FlgJ
MTPQMTPLQTQNLNKIVSAAVLCETATGCPAEISIAQAALESGWLSTMSGANNCFGIKSNSSIPGRELVSTSEWFTDAEAAHFLKLGDSRTAECVPNRQSGSRKFYRVRDWFAAFPTLADCFNFHGLLLQRGCYQPSWQQYQKDKDLVAYVKGMAVHYATAPTYAASVLEIAGGSTVVKALKLARGILA